MVRKAPKLRGVKAAVATLLAATLLAFACTAPRPSTPAPATGPAVEPEPLEQAPVFTPYTEAPRLRSPEQAVASVAGHYPEALKRAGVGGTVVVWLFVDERGAVRNTKVQKTSARPELDDAAQAAASEFEFIPARNRGRPVSVWVAIPITFEPPAQDPNEADRRALRATLRMIATVQESRWREAGRYYQDVAAEAVQDVIEEGVEIVLFEVRDSAWAAVARRGESECAMFYGDIPPPRPYARHGRAVCK